MASGQWLLTSYHISALCTSLNEQGTRTQVRHLLTAAAAFREAETCLASAQQQSGPGQHLHFPFTLHHLIPFPNFSSFAFSLLLFPSFLCRCSLSLSSFHPLLCHAFTSSPLLSFSFPFKLFDSLKLFDCKNSNAQQAYL